MAASASSQPYESPDEVGMRNSREARETRKAARAAKARQQNSGPYNNSHSPQREDYRGYGDGEEPYSPTSVDGLQDAILAQGGHIPVAPQQQQRGPDGRRAGDSQLPPGYPGPAYEDVPAPTKNGGHQGNTLPSSTRRQSAQPASSGRGPYGHSRAGSSSAEQLGSRRGQGPGQGPSSPREAALKASPSRLESPSVLKSVLQPLEKKINEYDRLMGDARTEMAQLDNELRALQERRQQAEDRFLSAKSKHDDYSRQHDDVGRAMRGDTMNNTAATLSAPHIEPQPISHAPMQRRVSFEERPPSIHSEASYKPRTRDRLRISLFKH